MPVSEAVPALSTLPMLGVLFGAGAAGGVVQSMARLLPADGSLTAVDRRVGVDLGVRAVVGAGAALLVPVLPIAVSEPTSYVAYGVLVGFAGPAVLASASAQIAALASDWKVKQLKEGVEAAEAVVADVERQLGVSDAGDRGLPTTDDLDAAKARLAEVRARLNRLRGA